MKRLAKCVAVCVLIVGAGYAACAFIAPTYHIRYRLTMDVEVDGIIHRGTGVVEISYQLLPDEWTRGLGGAHFHGFMEGCAITIDLGDRGLLFIVNEWPLLEPLDDREPFLFPNLVSMWSLPLVAYGFPGYGTSSHMQPVLQKLEHKLGPVDVALEDLPMLVRFRNILDHGPVYEVNPTDLPMSFGKGIRISRVTLELTSDAITPIPKNWPTWLTKADNVELDLRADDDRLRVSDRHIWTNAFKGD